MEYYAENGLQVYCDNGLLAETDECPCGCPDFEGRTICYVDKNIVGGTGDGSSWANAYTDIQTAINAHPKKEIQIQGYGESDCYPAGIVLAECVYLKGVDDVWIDGQNTFDFGISGGAGFVATNTLVKNINIKNCKYNPNQDRGAFYFCENLDGCSVKDTIFYGFYGYISAIDCNANNAYGGFSGKISTNCHTEGCGVGFLATSNAILTSCTANNCYFTLPGFFVGGRFNVTVYNCISSNNTGSGFYGSSAVFTNCNAFSNQRCGFEKNNVDPNTYIACTESGNCLGGHPSCAPGVWCDVV